FRLPSLYRASFGLFLGRLFRPEGLLEFRLIGLGQLLIGDLLLGHFVTDALGVLLYWSFHFGSRLGFRGCVLRAQLAGSRRRIGSGKRSNRFCGNTLGVWRFILLLLQRPGSLPALFGNLAGHVLLDCTKLIVVLEFVGLLGGLRSQFLDARHEVRFKGGGVESRRRRIWHRGRLIPLCRAHGLLRGHDRRSLCSPGLSRGRNMVLLSFGGAGGAIDHFVERRVFERRM